MAETQQYLAEEVAEDLADGIIARREALRRLGRLGVHGGLDARVNATRAAAGAALEAAGRRHELLTFTEADHAFLNDTPGPVSTRTPPPRSGGGR